MNANQLEDITNNILKILKEGGYKDSTIKRVQSCYKIIRNAIADDYTYEKGVACLKACTKKDKVSNEKLRALKYIDSYINNENILTIIYMHNTVVTQNYLFNSVKNEYELFLINKNLSKVVIASNLNYIKKFLEFSQISNITELTKVIIYNYLTDIKNNYSPASLSTITYYVRNFIEYLNENNYISFTHQEAIPRIVSQKKSNIMTYYTKDEIKEILSLMNNNTLLEKRNLAIVLLAVTYGLRASDIVKLKEDNIDWNNNKIELIQQKTKQNLILPMTQKIKLALLDYYKANYENIKRKNYFFLTLVNPIEACSASITYIIISKVILKTSINTDNRKRGLHTLRHSFAKNSLDNNVPITTIKEVLGHSSIAATTAYISINISELRNLSLEVPQL